MTDTRQAAKIARAEENLKEIDTHIGRLEAELVALHAARDALKGTILCHEINQRSRKKDTLDHLQEIKEEDLEIKDVARSFNGRASAPNHLLDEAEELSQTRQQHDTQKARDDDDMPNLTTISPRIIGAMAGNGHVIHPE